jgi:hypothetical protein
VPPDLDMVAGSRARRGILPFGEDVGLKGVSTCDFEEALIALLGKDAGGRLDHRAAEGRLVAGARALEQARSLGQTLCLLLG